jgi:hypothetical protein
MKTDDIKSKLHQALSYYAQADDDDSKYICNGIMNALVLVEASVTLPESSKERSIQLYTAREIANDCEKIKMIETGSGFEEVAA